MTGASIGDPWDGVITAYLNMEDTWDEKWKPILVTPRYWSRAQLDHRTIQIPGLQTILSDLEGPWGSSGVILRQTGGQSVSSVTQSYPTLCDPMDGSTPGFPVHHQSPELAQTHVHRVGDAIHPLSSPLKVGAIYYGWEGSALASD